MSLVDEGSTIASLIRPLLPEGFNFRKAKWSLEWVARKDGIEYGKLTRESDRWTIHMAEEMQTVEDRRLQWMVESKIVFGIYNYVQGIPNVKCSKKTGSSNQRARSAR